MVVLGVINQGQLEKVVHQIFPTESIHCRSTPSLSLAILFLLSQALFTFLIILFVIDIYQYIISNARDEAQIKNKLSDHYFEVDLWIPSMNLGFEFQVFSFYSAFSFPFLFIFVCALLICFCSSLYNRTTIIILQHGIITARMIRLQNEIVSIFFSSPFPLPPSSL